jgi:hypothetical protein
LSKSSKKKKKKKTHLKSKLKVGCWWLVPIILATWETEVRRMEVQDQARQIVHETSSPKQPE